MAERSGWRDEAISRRHRQWGFNCPGVDLDFVMVEYNHGQPVALVEYKERRAAPLQTNHPTYQALRALADGYRNGPLPFFVARYCSTDWWFMVTPLNEPAQRHYQHCAGQVLSEQRFVRSLHLLRKHTLDACDVAAIAMLNSTVPELVR